MFSLNTIYFGLTAKNNMTEMADFSLWADKEPKQHGKCVITDNNMAWSVAPCSQKHSVICQGNNIKIALHYLHSIFLRAIFLNIFS